MSESKADEARRVARAATEGPWYVGHNPDSADPIAYFSEAYSYGPPGRVHLVCVPFGDKDLNDEALFTAITGNGPTSEANAAFIAWARNNVEAMADEIDALRAELASKDVRIRELEALDVDAQGGFEKLLNTPLDKLPQSTLTTDALNFIEQVEQDIDVLHNQMPGGLPEWSCLAVTRRWAGELRARLTESPDWMSARDQLATRDATIARLTEALEGLPRWIGSEEIEATGPVSSAFNDGLQEAARIAERKCRAALTARNLSDRAKP